MFWDLSPEKYFTVNKVTKQLTIESSDENMKLVTRKQKFKNDSKRAACIIYSTQIKLHLLNLWITFAPTIFQSSLSWLQEKPEKSNPILLLKNY